MALYRRRGHCAGKQHSYLGHEPLWASMEDDNGRQNGWLRLFGYGIESPMLEREPPFRDKEYLELFVYPRLRQDGVLVIKSQQPWARYCKDLLRISNHALVDVYIL